MQSKASELFPVEFPKVASMGHTGIQCQMEATKVMDINNGAFHYLGPLLAEMTSFLNPEDVVYVTIDEQFVRKGNTQRRGGVHIDGNWFLTGELNGGVWKVGGYWGTDREFSRHGGMIIASNYSSCAAWLGEFKGEPGAGGCCDHMKDQLATKEKLIMKANVAYLTNSTCVHESLPLDKDVYRRLVRITLPADRDINTLKDDRSPAVPLIGD